MEACESRLLFSSNCRSWGGPALPIQSTKGLLHLCMAIVEDSGHPERGRMGVRVGGEVGDRGASQELMIPEEKFDDALLVPAFCCKVCANLQVLTSATSCHCVRPG